jgi:hypothetical protein
MSRGMMARVQVHRPGSGRTARGTYVTVRSAVNEVTTARTNPLDALRQAYVAADRAVETRLGLSH